MRTDTAAILQPCVYLGVLAPSTVGYGDRHPVTARGRWLPEQAREFLALMVEFATTLGYDVVSSPGKSHDSVRSAALDPGATAM